MGEGERAVLNAQGRGVLGAILANPSANSGDRTIRRVQLAGQLLGFAGVEIANLFAIPTVATGEIDQLGADPSGWLAARPALAAVIAEADGLLLAYGVREPNGAARAHFRSQVAWLANHVQASGLPAWWVGDGSRHPSRWQRWTHRAHPELEFHVALKHSLVRVTGPSVGASD